MRSFRKRHIQSCLTCFSIQVLERTLSRVRCAHEKDKDPDEERCQDDVKGMSCPEDNVVRLALSSSCSSEGRVNDPEGRLFRSLTNQEPGRVDPKKGSYRYSVLCAVQLWGPDSSLLLIETVAVPVIPSESNFPVN